jgi:hypothetical protein
MTFETWAGRILVLWLAIGMIGALLDGQVVRGNDPAVSTEDARIVNDIVASGIASTPSTNNPGITNWVTTALHVFDAFLDILTWNSSLFSGAIGTTIRVVFLCITAVAGMGLASKVFGRG